MALRACIVCGTPSPKSRCPRHQLRQRQFGGRTREAIRGKLAQRDGWRCVHCDTPDGPFVIDHITPVADGGNDHLTNLRLLCRSCHTQRHTAAGLPARGHRKNKKSSRLPLP